MEVDRTEVGGPLWKSCGSSWKFEIPVEVGGKYVGVYGSSWKLSLNIFVKAAINKSNGSFHFHASRGNFHAFPWSTNFDGNFHEGKSLPWKLPRK